MIMALTTASVDAFTTSSTNSILRHKAGQDKVPMTTRMTSRLHYQSSHHQDDNKPSTTTTGESQTTIDPASAAVDENGRWVASSILSAAVEKERDWLLTSKPSDPSSVVVDSIGGKKKKTTMTRKKKQNNRKRSLLFFQNDDSTSITTESSSDVTTTPTPITAKKRTRESAVKAQAKQKSCQQSYNRHAASDFWYNLSTLPQSSVLQDIRHPLFYITAWSTLVSVLHRSLLMLGKAKFASMMCMSKLPHSLLVSSLGLLLVFKTNSAYGRFQEGRQIWERIQSKSRDLTRMMALYTHDMTAPRKERVQNLLAAFPYLLRHHINPRCMSNEQLDAVPEPYKLQLEDEVFPIDTRFEDSVRSLDPANFQQCSHRHCTVDKRALPWRLLPAKSLNHIAKSRNRALWVCDRMSAEIASIPYTDTWQNRERLTMLQHVNELSRAIGECERIHQTLVPINYARHCLRSLTLWLLSLPFALLEDLGLKTGVVMMVLSWLMFGVYQIGYSIEDPFQGSIRLSIICDNIRREVLLESENGLRYTAFDDYASSDSDEDDSTSSLVMNATASATTVGKDCPQHGLMDASDVSSAGDYAYAPVQ